MSSVYKLSISGIRSFSDETQETIQFSKPLTLIVGTNGSGKTTIIECLRYATTNELPPNTKNGASFINDPNLHSANETRAQIKLAFQNTKKVNMILSKSLMATKNPRTSQISFKTKENQLMAIHHGEKQTVSSKVADIENLIPHHLGVSKAILNYVVFCHQDESLWPISESAVLKKKFDEIFDSSKFIKILDSIKTITKDINSDVKLINNNVEHLKNDKTRSQNKKKSIIVLQSQIDDNKKSMADTQSKVEGMTVKLQTLYTSNQDYERIISKMESLEQDKRNMIKNIESIKLTTELIHRPKDVLLAELNNFTDVLAKQTNKCKELEGVIDVQNKDVQRETDKLNTLLIQSGNLKALKEKNESNIIKRNQLIEQFAQQLDVQHPSEFDSKLEAQMKILKQEQDHNMEFYDEKINKISKDIDDTRAIIMKESQHIEYKNKDCKTLKNKIQELEARYDSITGNQAKLSSLRTSLTLKEETFAKVKALNEVAKLNETIETEAKAITRIEMELEENQQKLQITRRNNDLVSKLQVLKEMNSNDNREMEMVYNNISTIMPDVKNLKKFEISEKYQEELKRKEKKINRARADIESLKFRKSKVKTTCEHEIANKEDLESEIESLQSQFNQLQIDYKGIYGDNLKLENYATTVDEVETDFNSTYENVNGMQFYIQFNERALKMARNKEMCYLCLRKFHKESDPDHPAQLNTFMQLLNERTEKYKQQLGDKTYVERKEVLLNRLRGFKTSSVRMNKLLQELIPAVASSIKESQASISEYDDKLEEHEKDIYQQKEEFNKFRNIEHDVGNYERLNNAVMERKEQIKRLQDTLSEEGLATSTEELEAINKTLYSTLKTKRTDLESYRMDRDMKQKRNNELENTINQIKLNINDLELKSLDKINIEKAIKENKEQVTEIEHSLQQNKVKLDEALNLEKVQSELLREQEAQKSAAIEATNKSIEKFLEIKLKFSKIDAEMKEFKDNDITGKFERNLSLTKTAKASIESILSSISKSQTEMKRLESLVSDSSHQERNIRSNINLLNFEEDLESIELQIGQLDAKQAQAQRTQYLKQASALQEIQQRYQKDLATKMGETTQLERQMKDIHIEIDRDYKDVDIKYTTEYAKLQTKLAMATDLTTLYKATDNGVMEFHQTQMQKINNIIDELWKKTYMGNDVETIKIKADPIASVKKTKDTTATNNRSYNYRVVMVKNGTELDMRGRCSAGQRVLASIIIRIALAECFCLNFGMIALDEPTTNLDDENIESLAKALHSIIKERSVQRNFQLIIITHDEKFLRCMNAVDFTDHYYKVMRDERLNSTINKVSIATVTE